MPALVRKMSGDDFVMYEEGERDGMKLGDAVRLVWSYRPINLRGTIRFSTFRGRTFPCSTWHLWSFYPYR